MSKPVGSLSSGPACEASKVIVQVIGKDHPATQKVVLCDPADKVQKARTEPQEKEICSSVLHVWNCTSEAKRKLWLEIDSTQGKPIRLPLLADVRSTPRESDVQWNQIVPVLPFVSLPGSKSAYDYGTPVLARAGFIYVFYKGKLWRELEVRILEGKTTYHDVDIAHYRQGKIFKTGERKVTGVALEDIWIPSLWNNQKVLDLQMCFSEIQLHAARLQRFEEDSRLRSQRCKNPQNLVCSNKSFKDLYTGKPDGKAMLEAFSNFNVHNYTNSTAATQATVVKRNLESGCFPVSVAAPQRSREPGYEGLLDHPGRYLCDLSGQFPVTASKKAKAFLQACTKGTSENNDPVQRTELLELSAVTDALAASMLAPAAPDNKETPTDVWIAQASVADSLAKARQRQICGVLLEDPRYRLRHLKSRLETHQELLKLCARYATQQADHASALLIQQLVVPSNLQGKPNPLHASLKKVGSTGKERINQCTAVLERTMVWQHMTSAQNLLTESLQQDLTQQTLADHLSLDGFDYLSALFVISQTIAALAAPPSRLDPLAPSGDVVDAVSGVTLYSPKATMGQQWLASLANSAQTPLHLMFWPECDMERACKPYQVPQLEKNKGDGKYRPSELAKLENKVPPATAQLTTMDADIVANLLAGASLDSFLITSGKNISSALLGIYDTLQSAVESALAATLPPREAFNQASADADASNDARNRANDRMQRTRDRLAERARPVNVKLHARGVEQLRSMMPNTFGPAYFMRRGAVTQSYYLFGLEDLPTRESVPVTYYGEFLDNSGKLLGSTDRTRLPEAGVVSSEHLVLVIPRNHSTAQLVRNMNQQLTAAQLSNATSDAANARVVQTGSALTEAVDQHRTRNSAPAFRILNSRPFSIAVLMLEMWNVNAELQGREAASREKNKNRVRLGVLAAGIDLIIAMESLTVKLLGTQSALALARKPIYDLADSNVKRWIGKALTERLTQKITARLITQSFSGIIFAGISLYDAWYAWQWNDNAMYGYLLMAGGAAAGVVAGMATGAASAGPVLGLTPLGWLALLLIGTGAGLVLWLSSTPLEDWLLNGPFASEGEDNAKHLKDSQEAFYRLIGLLSGIGISVKQNTLFDPNSKLDIHSENPFEVRSANTLIRIESRLPGLIGSIGSIGIQAECRMREVVTTNFRGSPLSTQKSVSGSHPIYKAQRIYMDALELYVDTPKMIITPKKSTGFEWAVRAQFVLTSKSETRYFPAPGVKDPTRFNAAYAKADFNKTNRPFWADEQTNKA